MDKIRQASFQEEVSDVMVVVGDDDVDVTFSMFSKLLDDSKKSICFKQKEVILWKTASGLLMRGLPVDGALSPGPC